MAEDPWYKRVVSPLRTTWERVKAFASEVDPEAVANDAWRYEMGCEKRRILRDGYTGTTDPETTRQLLRENRDRRQAAWRAFHPDAPEPELSLSWVDRWIERSVDRHVQRGRAEIATVNDNVTTTVIPAHGSAVEVNEPKPPEERHCPSPAYGPRYLAAKAAYLAEVQQRHQEPSPPEPPPA